MAGYPSAGPGAVQNALSLRILLFLSDSYEHRSTFRLNNVILQIRE